MPRSPKYVPPTMAEAQKGHPAKVSGLKGQWTFQKYDAERGEVTVYGGPGARRQTRTFLEDRITLLKPPPPE